MTEPLYLTITRGSEARPILATSDPTVISAVVRALSEVLGGKEQRRVLKLTRAADVAPKVDHDG